MNYSKTFIGIALVVGLPVLTKLGLSETCGEEVINWVIGSMIPGLALIWQQRISRGDVNMAGFKKVVK